MGKNKGIIMKSSPFDLDFSKEYQSLRKSKKEIQRKIDPLVTDATGNFQQIKVLVAKRKVYDDAIIKLLQKETQEHCEQYARRMFDISVDIIVTYLADAATRFDTLSVDNKLKFGQTFINYVAKHFRIAQNKLILKEDMPQSKGAEYDFKTGDININKNYIGDLQYFIGAVLHEYTHHLYVKHPERSPLGEQKVAAVMENFIADSPIGIVTEEDLIAYKQRPFEAIAYYLQDYFEKQEFGKQEAAQITAKRKIMDISSTTSYDNVEMLLMDLFLDKINNPAVDIDISADNLLEIQKKVKNTENYKSFFDKDKLEKFMHRFYKASKDKRIVGFQISIPRPLSRTSVIAGTHAVALIINPIKKRIIYHDSTGFDMPQELKMIFDKCFKDYTVVDYHDKSQFTEKGDGSCSYLSMLNIYYRIMDELGRKPDKDLDFSAFAGADFRTDTRSEKLREYIWKELKGELLETEIKRMKTEKEQSTSTDKKPVFSFGKVANKASALDDPNYELYKDPEFKTWLDNLSKSLALENNGTIYSMQQDGRSF